MVIGERMGSVRERCTHNQWWSGREREVANEAGFVTVQGKGQASPLAQTYE